MSHLALDLRTAFRALVRGRFGSALAVLAFALGIGVTTAVFTIFNAVILRPLPYPDSDRLVVVYGTQPSCATCPASFPEYHDWKTRNQVLSVIGGSTPAAFVMTGRGDATRVTGMATTASLAAVYGVAPAIGRWYTEQEDQFGGPKLVVLSHPFWMKYFNADPAVLGRTVVFDGAPYEIIGVTPETFPLSSRFGDVFVPLQRKLDPAKRGEHFLSVSGRLRDGVTLERATADMRALGRVLAREFGGNHGIDVQSYQEAVVGRVRSRPADRPGRGNTGVRPPRGPGARRAAARADAGGTLAGVRRPVGDSGCDGAVRRRQLQRHQPDARDWHTPGAGRPRGTVARMVLREVAWLGAAGAALGVALFMAGNRVLGSMVFEVSPDDPLTIAVAGLSLVSTMAGLLPARRAASVDPAVTLRSE